MERLRELLAIDDDTPRRGLRLLAGLLLVLGMMLVFVRRSSLGDRWGDLPLLLVLLAPCVFFYGIGLLAAREDAQTRGWESVYVVAGLLLIPLVGFQFLELIDGDENAPLNSAWIFGLTAAAGVAAGLLAGVRFALLAAGLAAIIVWLAIFDEVLEDGVAGDIGTFRGLMVLIALILLASAFLLLRRDSRGGLGDRVERHGEGALAGPGEGPRGGGVLGRFAELGRPLDLGVARGSELVTAAGVAAVTAGAISVARVTALVPFGEPPPFEASLFWDLELLVVSLALIAFAAWSGTRGPGYVGAFGLLFFITIVGLDLDDDSPEGSLLGWPLILLVLGALAFVASLVPGLGTDRFGRRGGGDGPAAPAPGTVPAAPPAGPAAPPAGPSVPPAPPPDPPTERLDPPGGPQPPPPPAPPGAPR